MCPKYKEKEKVNYEFTWESTRLNKHNGNHTSAKKKRNVHWVVNEKTSNPNRTSHHNVPKGTKIEHGLNFFSLKFGNTIGPTVVEQPGYTPLS